MLNTEPYAHPVPANSVPLHAPRAVHSAGSRVLFLDSPAELAGIEPTQRAEGVRTPGGRHLSDAGRAEILTLSRAGMSMQKIAGELEVSKATVQAVVERAAIPAQRAEGVMTPDGRHVSDAGRARILELSEGGISQQQIAVQLGLQRSTVRSVILRAAIPAQRAEGVMTPGGRHLSDAGRARILELSEGGISQQQIGVQLGLPKSTVQSVIMRGAIPAQPAVGVMMPDGGPLSDAGRARILELSERGISQQQIGLQLGLQRSTVRSVILRAAIPAQRAEGVMTPGGRHLSDAGRARILALSKDGKSMQQIAVLLGLPRTTVHHVIKTARERGEAAS
ncbi:helix-turn-helix domain-containing protein, partial [Burkholderia vietnamiensis]|nr:helix-turn-helix domain-containing protein [Burkholderia vietnamiensis]